MSRTVILGWTACALALSSLGQEIQFGGPVTGLVYDGPTKSLRWFLGIPGAARLGDAVAQGLDWASVAPDGQRALLIQDGTLRTTSGDGQFTAVSGPVEPPQLAAWASNSIAVVYSASKRTLQWIRLGAGGAFAERPISLAGVTGAVTSLAADAASGLAVIAVARGGAYRVTSDRAPVPLWAAADVSSLALEPGGGTLWVADRGNTQLIEIAKPASDGTATTLIASPDKLAGLAGIALSSDGKTLYLVTGAARRFYQWDRASATLSDAVVLEADAASIAPLGSSLFLLGARQQALDPLYLFQPGHTPGVFFVPPPAGGAAQ
jgi:hypothetical protein